MSGTAAMGRVQPEGERGVLDTRFWGGAVMLKRSSHWRCSQPWHLVVGVKVRVFLGVYFL